MINFLFLALVGIAVVHGASVGSKAKGCSVSDGYFALSCGLRTQEFGSKMKELDVNDLEEMKEFKNTCNIMENCFNNTCKDFLDAGITEAYTLIQTLCNVINYAAGPFKQCADKLEANKSKCYADWDPFLDNEELKDKKKKDEACKNFFGKDQCMKKEITETCGQKEWEALRDHYIKFDKDIVKQCSLKNFFN